MKKLPRCPFCDDRNIGLEDKHGKLEMIEKHNHFECPDCEYTITKKK